MGKVNKRKAVKHSNHHDSPHRLHKNVVRRQHSQHVPRNTRSPSAGDIVDTKTKKSGNQGHNNNPKPRVPFSKWDQVLLVGEGDFSFALSLADHHRPASILATCFDSRDALLQKYPEAIRTIAKLSGNSTQLAGECGKGSNSDNDVDQVWNGFSPTSSGGNDEAERKNDGMTTKSKTVSVQYGIDATKLSSSHKKCLKPHSPFTKIVFNFPHVGGLSTDVNRQVRANQKLLVDFFNAAKSLLATESRPAKHPAVKDSEDDLDDSSDVERQHAEQLKHGQILVTMFEGEPYTLWNIRDLARHSGLKVLESFKFPWSAYPGYRHARTAGDITTGKDRSDEGKRKGAWRGEERDARCYILALQEDDDGRPAPGSRKRKKEADEDASD